VQVSPVEAMIFPLFAAIDLVLAALLLRSLNGAPITDHDTTGQNLQRVSSGLAHGATKR
jgi:hypothetical protein